jgi:HAD superfamily phosphatase
VKVVANPGYRPLSEGVYTLETNLCVQPAAVDAVIFDVDGVLVDVSGSFRRANNLSVQHYFNRFLNIPGDELLIDTAEYELFKLAGNFNNDWDLSKAAVAYCLMKQICGDGSADTAAIRKLGPPLKDFTASVSNRGGGLENALSLVRETLDGAARNMFESKFNPELIKRIFMEYYAGPEHCEQLYGVEAMHYHGPGLIQEEVFLLNLSLIERLQLKGVKFGILSGRTPEEADYLFRREGLDKLLAPEFILTDDGALPAKPNPAGLATLAGRMGFSAAVYVGDVPDDWTTVQRYRTEHGGLAPVAGCMVSTGTTSGGMMDRYLEKERVDYLAADVNHLLTALNDAL